MRLITWNVCRGAESLRWTHLERLIGAEAMLLQEVPEPPRDRICLWHEVPGYGWGSAVVVSGGGLTEIPVAGYEGWVMGGEWLGAPGIGPDEKLFLFSVHSPSENDTVERGSYVRESTEIVKAIHGAVPSDALVIIGGDFNFKSLGERVDGEVLRTTPEERRALETLSTLGLVPVWPAVHPGKPLPQTLRWVSNRVTPYHCDGFLTSREVAETALCEVLTAGALERGSDHFPVALWIS